MNQPNELKLGDTRTDPKGVPQIYVPAGRFMMGSTQEQVDAAFEEAKLYYPDAQLEWFTRELPQHEVHITRGFWLDQYHVTNDYYQAFMDDGGYREDRWWTAEGLKWRHSNNIKAPQDYKNFIENPLQPRVGITWHEAEAYASWRGGRLPTEAEWEYAARGEQALVFPWGNEYDQQKLNSYRLIGKTTPVDAYPNSQSWCGAFDMAGNVWDWCTDWFHLDFYAQCVKNNLIENPVAMLPSENRTLRGGAWSYTPVTCRTMFRYENLPYRSNAWGCRLVSAATS